MIWWWEAFELAFKKSLEKNHRWNWNLDSSTNDWEDFVGIEYGFEPHKDIFL